MSLSTRSIVTLNEVKNYLKLSTGASDLDTVIEDFIDLVSGKWESETHNKCILQDVEEILDGPRDDFLMTTYFPIYALYGESAAERLANLQYRESPTDAWVDLTDDEDYIYISDDEAVGVQLLSPAVYIWGKKNTRVHYWVGTARESVPADIRKIVLEAVAVMWKESGQGDGRLGLSSQSGTISGGSTGYEDLARRWDAVVSRHRRLV